MNILEQTEALKDLPDQALIKEMQMPTGMAPPVFITAELKRRQRMRDDFKRREAQDMPTVAEEVVMAAGMPQGGIADAARAMAPKSSIAQNTGMNEMMPAAATRAPQRMAEGGIMKLREGGKLVKVGNARFYAFPDGEVYFEKPDGSREAVTDPRALGVIRQQANVGPERQDSATPLGSEVLSEAAPQRPSLDSAISSDRPFSPLSTEVTDTRPATPSDLGMGGERPSTLTAATQPAINQQQILLDAMKPAFDTFGGEPLARAEERSNLSAPSLSDISPTIPALSEMEKARLATEFTQQQELARAIRDQQEAEVSPTVDLDLTGGGTNKKDLDAFLESQIMSGGRPGGSLPVDVLSEPVTDDTYRMPDVTDPSDIFYGDDISPFDPSDIKRPREEFLAEVARQDPLDLPTRSTSLTPLQSIGGQDNVEVAASANPLPVTDSGANPFADAYESFQDSIKQAEALGNAAKVPPLKQILMEQGIAEVARQDPFDVPQSEDPSFPDGFTLGTAGDAASNALSFGDVNKLISDDDGGGGGGDDDKIVPTGGAATGLEARIAQMLSDREADRETDKYMALAQAGLALMASKNPTLGGAIGEAGLAGVGALKKAKSQYDADILGLMGLEEKARSSRLSREAALAKANRPKAMTGTEKAGYFDRASELEDQIAEIEAQLASGKQANPVTGLMTDDMTDEAKALLERRLISKKSQMNKFLGIANPQLANVQTFNPS